MSKTNAERQQAWRRRETVKRQDRKAMVTSFQDAIQLRYQRDAEGRITAVAIDFHLSPDQWSALSDLAASQGVDVNDILDDAREIAMFSQRRRAKGRQAKEVKQL